MFAGAGFENKVTTCVFPDRYFVKAVHRLACNDGVISVLKTVSGSTRWELCTGGRSDLPPPSPHCSRPDAVDKVKTRCDGMRSCEVALIHSRNPDSCVGTANYLHTTFTCVEALTVVACERSTAQFNCDSGYVIAIYGALYGRRDRTTCSDEMSADSLRNVVCIHPVTALVAQRCDGQSSCSVRAGNAEFTDPCRGISKYLEISYACKPLEAHDEDVPEAVLPCAPPSI
ncbi:L-rhamnose-binding lectin SML-like [Hippocampus zosterae]|uniref:L-rhamnose-binding lectin SML-like n=1 Tax=Hippocampus zosterae TaxID=109293 RepID=UPI00223E75FE|nr:L-rhamnose-binding lectin SML-like [Hippocampus zosterae]